jgi:hypothetical protein
MSRYNILFASAALLAGCLALPDVEGDVAELRGRVALLETRVTELEEESRTAPNGDSRPRMTKREAQIMQLTLLEAHLGLEPGNEEGDLAARAWHAKVNEAAIQGFQFALQVAGNEGLLRSSERPELGSLVSLRTHGADIAEPALATDSVNAAYEKIEAGVRAEFVAWAAARGRDPEPTADKLVGRWRSAGLSIVREKLEEGVTWRNSFRVAAD